MGPYRSYTGARRYNLCPFKTIRNYLINSKLFNTRIIFINIAANIITFIPLGFFLPLLFKRLNRLKDVFVISILIITVIEILQLILNVGVFDIDDIILNTFGCILGFLLNKLFN